MIGESHNETRVSVTFSYRRKGPEGGGGQFITPPAATFPFQKYLSTNLLDGFIIDAISGTGIESRDLIKTYTKALTGILKGSQNYVDVRLVVRSILMLMEVRSFLSKERERADNIIEP
jgi:hypothetical protein